MDNQYKMDLNAAFNAGIMAAYEIALAMEIKEWEMVGDPRLRKPVCPIANAIKALATQKF
jgi:hypothetical protein